MEEVNTMFCIFIFLLSEAAATSLICVVGVPKPISQYFVRVALRPEVIIFSMGFGRVATQE